MSGVSCGAFGLGPRRIVFGVPMCAREKSRAGWRGVWLGRYVIATLLVVALGGAARAEGDDGLTKPVLEVMRGWSPANQPLKVRVNPPEGMGGVRLLLVDFIGNSTSARLNEPVSGDVELTLKFREAVRDPGTYLLLAIPPSADGAGGGEQAGASPAPNREKFLGTPLVVEVRADSRRNAAPGAMVFRVTPLRYAVISTTAGDLKACFYYDTAPNTVDVIQRLMREGFYTDLPFFRVEPGFVVQTGDPRGDGTGGPGFFIDAEFSDRPHLPGVLSLARLTDTNEAPGLQPRSEYANSGGSQFFICLDYKLTRQLDRRYTAFGRLVDSSETLNAIAGSGGGSEKNGRPKTPVVIKGVKLVDVTPGDNPYARLKVVEGASTQPSGPSGAAEQGASEGR